MDKRIPDTISRSSVRRTRLFSENRTMIKFQKEHQTRWAHANDDNFSNSAKARGVAIRGECDEIQLPNTGCQRPRQPPRMALKWLR